MSATTYQQRKQAGLCTACGQPSRPFLVLCGPCSASNSRAKQRWAARHAEALQQQRHAQRDAAWLAPGPNHLACCDTWHPISQIPFRTGCCGRVYFAQEER